MKLTTFAVMSLGVSLVSASGWAETGKAVITAAQAGALVEGSVMLEDSPAGLKMTVDIQRAPMGKHAFHIHEFGSCEDEGKAAGSHYNPATHPHGNTLKDGVVKVHAGDFGSLTVDAKGKASLQAVVPGLTLSGGKYNVAGRAFVLHEKEDDFSQPTGNAGGRIGCGTIVITGK